MRPILALMISPPEKDDPHWQVDGIFTDTDMTCTVQRQSVANAESPLPTIADVLLEITNTKAQP